MIEQMDRENGKILGFKMSGKLHDEDYQKFVPLVETAIQAHGKVRLLAEFVDFHGWDLHALWDDTKFTVVFVTHSIPEAIRVGSRILLLTAHPGQVKAEINSCGNDAQGIQEASIESMLFEHV